LLDSLFYNQGGPIQIDTTNASAFASLLRGLTRSLGSMALESLINPPVLIMNYLVRKGNQAINSKKKDLEIFIRLAYCFWLLLRTYH